MPLKHGSIDILPLHYTVNKITLMNIKRKIDHTEALAVQGRHGNTENTVFMTHKTVTSWALISYDMVRFHTALWHCSAELMQPPSYIPAAEKCVMTASFKLIRLAAMSVTLVMRFRLTVFMTEQLRSTAALLCRDMALSCWTDVPSSLSAMSCSVKKDDARPSMLSGHGCITGDSVSLPTSCVVAEGRCTKHRMLPLSRMTSNDPKLLRPTPHVPVSTFSHQLQIYITNTSI